MTTMQLRRAARITGALMALGIAILTADWAVVAIRTPRDDRTIAALQEQVREDPTVSETLDAEQKRITDAKLARHARDRAIAWGLIACSAVFLFSVKRLLALSGRKTVEMSKIAAAQAPAGKKRKRKSKTCCGAHAHEDANTVDVSFVDEAVAHIGSGKEAAIPLLQAIQQHYRYLPDEAIRRVCEITGITPAEIAGTSSFYGQFRSAPVGKHIVRVCHGTACHVAGARQISDELRRHLKIPEGSDTDADRMFTLEEVACLGCCSLAPVLMVDEHTAGRLTPTTATAALEDVEEKEPA